MAKSVWDDLEEVKENNNSNIIQNSNNYKSVWDDLEEVNSSNSNTPNFQDIEPHPYINMAKDVAKKALNKSTEMLNGMRDNFNNPQQVQPQIQQPIQQPEQPIVKPVLNTQNANNNNQVHITNPLDNYNLKDVTNRGIDMLMRPETYTRDANAYQMETNNLNALGNNNSGVPTFKLSATQNVLTNPAIQQLKGAEKQEFAKRAIKAIVNEKLTPQQEIENNYNSRANYELANKINADMLDSLERSKANYYADNGLEQLGQGNISDWSINPISQGEYIADKLRTNIEPLQNNVIKPIGNVINDIGAGVTQGIALAPYQLYQMVTEPFRTIKSDIATRNNKEKPLSYGEFKKLSISEQKDYVNKLRKDSDVIAGVQTAFAKGGVNLVNSVIDSISNTPYMLSASATGKDYKKVIEVKKLEKELAHKLGVNASTNEVGKALVNHLRDVKDKANDYKTVTALSEFVVSMLPFVPKSKTFISKIPDKSKLSGYISTTAKTVKPNELANAIKTGASIGAVLSGGDTDLQGTIANATAGGLGGATLHEGGKVIKEGTKLVGKISDNVKTNIEKAKYINELKKNPDNWVYETETKPTGKMRGLGLSQTPEMKTETKRVFSPFVDVDNMKSGAYKERISKTDYKELGNKKNEVEIWKPNHELGESGELKQGSLYGNVSANGVVNQGGSARPLLVDKQNPNYEKDIENLINAKNNNSKVDIGPVSDNVINAGIKANIDLRGYRHNIDKSALNHIINRHGKTENYRNQIPITNDDIKNIPDVIYNADKVEYSGKNKQGKDVFKYTKTMEDGNIYYAEEVRTGKKQLSTQTMHKISGRSNVIKPKSPTSETISTNNSITDNSETFKGGVEESNITPEKQKELETQEKINWERTLKRRDNVDIEIIKRAANLKNGKKYSTGEIKMLIGSARRGTLNTPSLRSRFDKLMKLVEEPDDRITVQGGLSEFAEFHNPNATDEELVNAAINNLLHNRKPLNITERENDYTKHLEQMYNDIENVRTQLLNVKTDVEAFEIYEQKANELIKKYPNEISDDTFVEFVNIINDKYEQSSYNKENEEINEYISNVNGSGQGIYEKTSERNKRRTRKSNDDNIERVSKNDGNEYTQETSTDRRTDVTPLENSEKINNNEEKGVDNERQIDRRTNQRTNRENSKKLSTTLQMDKTMVSEQSKRLDTNNQGTIRPNRSERTTDNVTIGNERLTKESKISSSDKELIEKEYKNQHELNLAIENYINNGEYKKYQGSIRMPQAIKDWLKKYAGAGGLEKQGAEGKGLLSEYYTPQNIVNKMWEMTAQYINTDGAKVLEPSVGIGRFLETAPQNTSFDVVEMNPVSAKIAKILYPNANVSTGEFQERFIDKFKNLPIKNVTPEYDIVIGNPPYGQYSGRYKGLGEGRKHARLESYFINRGLDSLKENGILTFIVPSTFLNGMKTFSKLEIGKKCELIDAYRLPEKTFDTTSIGTDIIVLRKTNNKSYDENLSENNWFNQHPEKILGSIEERKNKFGKLENYVKGDKNAVDKIDTSKKDIKETVVKDINVPHKTTTKKSNHIASTSKKVKSEPIEQKTVEYEEYKAKNPVSDEDYKYFADTRVDGTLPKGKYSVGEKVNQYKGELYNDFNYLQGNIYEKLDALETENLPKEQKEKQMKKLLSVLPKPKTLNEIKLTPTSDFVREFPMKITVKDYMGNKVEEPTSLDKKYIKYVRDLTKAERNNINVWDIEKFVNGDSIKTKFRGSKEEKENKRAGYLTRLKKTVDKTFNDFINSELPKEDKERFIDKWNRTFNGIYTPDYNKMPMFVKGLSATFKGEKLKLQNVQVEGINYLTNKGVGLLGFEVGVGKTLSGIISTVQNMQMGRCKKPLILVPKQVKPNWIREIHEAFPNMKVNDLDNLSKFSGSIDDNTISVATFQVLDNIWYGENALKELTRETYSINNDFSRESTKRGLEKSKERIEQFIGKAEKGNKKKYNLEDLGIDHITVDEAHNFKNLFGAAKADGQQGNTYTEITGAESTRAKRLFLATQHILNQNNNRNVFMLTATPFNNNPLEVFNMLTYLAKDKLDKMCLYNVYQFMENYVDISADWVVDSKNDVVYKQVASGFKNLQSLQGIIKSCMLIRSAEDAGVKRPNKHTRRVVLEPTQEQLDIIAEAEQEAITAKSDDKGAILRAISKSRIATISPDIYNKNLEVSAEDFIKNSPKLEYVMNAIESMKNSDAKTSQLLYMPIGVDFLPKIKEYLVNKGVYNANEIGIIKAGVNDDKINEIVDSFNDKKGDIKLIIGTNKMKEGMNLNQNSSVLYVPYMDWNPTDYMQIVGRIWRRGNNYDDIRVVVPLLKDSTDSFMFQKLDEKIKRLNNIMDTTKDYIDTSELSTADEKINMITNPDKKANMFSQIEKQKLDNQKSTLQGKLETTQHYKSELEQAKKDVKNAEYWVNSYKEKLENIEDKESYQYSYTKSSVDSYKKELSKAKQNLKYVENKIERLELDFKGKDSEENINKEIEKIDKKLEDLKETTEKKREEYQKEYNNTRAKGKNIDELIKEFEEDTKNLYENVEENGESYSIDIPDFMKKQNNEVVEDTGLDIDLDNIHSKISKGIKGRDLMKLLPNEIAEIFEKHSRFRSYTFKNLDTNSKSTKGVHYNFRREIHLNLDAIKDSPSKFVKTLLHELRHAQQEYEYLEIIKKPKNQRTNNENLFVENYKKCKEVNRKKQIYYNKHKDLIDRFRQCNYSSAEERANAISQLSQKEQDILDTYDNLFKNYWNSQFEVEAREQGELYAKKYRQKSGYSLSRTFRTEQTNTGTSTEWNLGPNSRNSSTRGGKLSTNERGLGQNQGRDTQFLGEYSEEQPEYRTEPTRQEINKATTLSNSDSAVQRVAKNEVRKWYGGIEKDRYDVNKNLSAFVRHTDRVAKDLSKKLGFKVNGKMVREIMPFLRERTDFPMKLDRKDLKRLFTSLSSQDKAILRSDADVISNKLQKYYENYNYAHGIVPDEQIENHISHIWDLDNKKSALLTSYFSTKSKFAKQRTIETLVKGIDGFEVNGEMVNFKPKTLDYAEILKISSDSLIKATHDIMLAENVKNLKKGNEKLVLPINKAPKDWVEINHPALNKCVYRGGNEDMAILERTPVAVHPSIANTLLTVFERQKPDNKFWKLYDKTGAIMKYGELSLSGFHGFALSESSIGNVGLRKTLQELNPLKIIDNIKNGNYYVYQNEKSAKDALTHGLSLGTPLDVRRSLIEQVPVIGKVAELNNKVLWDHLHSTYKLIAYETLCEQQEHLTDDIKNDIAQWVNDSFGGQAWELLGIRPSQVKVAHRAMLSPDWFISTTRQFLGSLSSEKLFKIIDKTQFRNAKETFRMLGLTGETAEGSKIIGKVGRKFWLKSAIIMMLGMYNVLNACFREKDRREHPEYYDKMTPWDYSIWSNTDSTDDMAQRMLPYIFIGRNKDGTARYLRLGKQFREIPELLSNPIMKISPKLNPIINTTSNVLYGRDVANSIKSLTGNDSFNNQDIWNGYGKYATMKEGKDLALGRANVIKKSFMPYIIQNAMNEKHNKSAWDFVAQTSNGLSSHKLTNKYETALKRNYTSSDIDKITKRAIRDGMTSEQIENSHKYALKNYKRDNTLKYKQQYIDAIKSQDMNKIEKIGRNDLPASEKRRIYEKAYNEVLEESLKGKE